MACKKLYYNLWLLIKVKVAVKMKTIATQKPVPLLVMPPAIALTVRAKFLVLKRNYFLDQGSYQKEANHFAVELKQASQFALQMGGLKPPLTPPSCATDLGPQSKRLSWAPLSNI